MSTSILKSNIHSILVKSVLEEIYNRASKYYFVLGNTKGWDGNIPEADSSLETELKTRLNLVYAKEITPNDVAIIIPRYNWAQNGVYDQYDQYNSNRLTTVGKDNALELARFYVLTSEMNVYKCISNNNGSISTVMPTGILPIIEELSDGYKWKYMYTIPPSLRNKFLSGLYMPVMTAVNLPFYSNGMIGSILIENRGSGYTKNITLNGTIYSPPGNDVSMYNTILGRNTKFKGKVNIPAGFENILHWEPNLYCELKTDDTGNIIPLYVYYGNNIYSVSFSAPNQLNGNCSDSVWERPVFTLNNNNPITHSNGTVLLTYVNSNITYTITEECLNIGNYVKINDVICKIKNVIDNNEIELDNPIYAYNNSITKLNTIIEIYNGDGYDNNNPYIITGLKIINTGEGYKVGDLFMPASSDLPNGPLSLKVTDANKPFVAKVTSVTQTGNIKTIDLIYSGFGFTRVPTNLEYTPIDNNNPGKYAQFNIEYKKSSAYLEPIINDFGEIERVNIINPGIGYTYCILKVRNIIGETDNNKLETTSAIIKADVSVGNIETAQASTEVSAINGAIHHITIDSINENINLNNYDIENEEEIIIEGDGYKCTGKALFENKKILKVDIATSGYDYTYANVVFKKDTLNEIIKLRAIISPPGGHGHNAITELFGRTLCFTTKINEIKLNSLTVDNLRFYQMCLFKNLKSFNSNLFVTTPIASAVYAFKIQNTNDINNISLNNPIILNNDNNTLYFNPIGIVNQYILASAKTSNDEIVNNNYKLFAYIKQSENNNAVLLKEFIITDIIMPTFEKYKGEMLTIDNAIDVIPSKDQTVTLISKFKL